MRNKSIICFIVVNLIARNVSANDISQTDQQVTNGLLNTVTSCPWNGQGYIKLPGFDTCLKLGGELQADVVSNNLLTDETTQFTDTTAYIESRLSFDTKTHIDGLKLATYSTLKFIWNQESSAAQIEAERAALELSNSYFSLGGGIQESLYTGFTGYSKLNLVGDPWSDNRTLQASLQIPMGHFKLGFAVEDIVFKDTINGNQIYFSAPKVATKGDYAFITALTYSDNILNLKGSLAFIDVSNTDILTVTPDSSGQPANLTETNSTAYNYAVNFNAEFRPIETLKFSLGGQFGNGAIGYTGLHLLDYEFPDIILSGEDTDYVAHLFLSDPDGLVRSALFNQSNTLNYTIMGGFDLHLLPNIHLAFDVTYEAFDFDQEFSQVRGDGYTAQSALIWQPTLNLGVMFGASYSSRNFEGMLDVKNNRYAFERQIENLKIGTRVQYVFDPAN